MPICFRCRNVVHARPVDAAQDDICARCLRNFRVAAGILPPAEPPPCDPDLAPLRDRIEHGPIPPWGFTSDDYERLLAEKWRARADLDEHPSDRNLRRYRTAERGLRRLQEDNARRRAEHEARRLTR